MVRNMSACGYIRLYIFHEIRGDLRLGRQEPAQLACRTNSDYLTLEPDRTILQPRLDVRWWSLLDRFRTGQLPSRFLADLHK